MKAAAKILDVRIENFSISEIKEKISEMLNDEPRQKFVATLNPEILLKAHRDPNYKKILNSSDLNICDGFGIKMVSCLKKNCLKARFAGADLADFLLDLAAREKSKVLVVASKDSLSKPEEIERAISKKHPDISAKSIYFSAGQEWFENAIIKSAEIVFVNFGAPEQEKFIFENKAKFPSAKLLVGVGGTFDFLTGKIRRAPRWMRSIGTEWLWRLIQEPKRFRRIWNAVAVFPAAALLKEKL